MYRSWAYILIVMATMIGIVALLWPSPEVRTIAEIAAVPREAPRAEPPPKAPKQPAKQQPQKPAKPAAAAPAPPAVVRKMPTPNTTTRRAAPVLNNGLEPGMFGKPAGEAPDVPLTPPGANKPGGLTARPAAPARPDVNKAPSAPEKK